VEAIEAINLNRGVNINKKEVNHLHKLFYSLFQGGNIMYSPSMNYNQDDIVQHYNLFKLRILDI